MEPTPVPEVSVIIPTYNRAHLLPKSIESVLRQTFTNFELLVVDDASSDETEEVVTSFEDPRIRYVRRETNGGNAATRNTGIQNARADVVSFLDSDDEYLPDFLQSTYHALQEADDSVGFSWTGTVRVTQGENGTVTKKRELWDPEIEGDRFLYFLESRRVGTCCGVAVRKRCFDTAGYFDADLRAAVDTDFFIRLARDFDFTVIPRVLVRTHNHDGHRVSRELRHKAQAYERIIEKHGKALRDAPRVHSRLCYKAAWLYYHSRERAKGRAYMTQALRAAPRNYKGWLALVFFECFGAAAPALHKLASRAKKQLAGRAEDTIIWKEHTK